MILDEMRMYVVGAYGDPAWAEVEITDEQCALRGDPACVLTVKGPYARSDRRQGLAKRRLVDLALGDNATVHQDHGHTPVIEAVQLAVGIDIAKLGIDSNSPQCG